MEIKKWRGSVSFHAFTDWDDFLVLTDFVNDDDLMVLISARKNAVSYQKYLDHIPSKLEKHFNSNNKIMVYPQQNDQIIEKKDVISSVPFDKEDDIKPVKRKFNTLFKKQ